MRNRLVVGVAALLLLALPVLAQNNTGIISGRVTDPSGAVIPDAQITVTHIETNVDAVSATNSDGLFRVPSLLNGAYKVAITAAGFKKQVRDGLTLRIGENLNVDIRLEVGSVSDSVEVTSALPLLETQSSSTGQVMAGEYFYKLPNYQHWSRGVLYYTPQVGSTNAPWPGSLGNWNINGGQTYQTAQYEDGIMATSMDGGTTLNSVVGRNRGSEGADQRDAGRIRPCHRRRPHYREESRHQHAARRGRRALQEHLHDAPPLLPEDNPAAG